MPVAIEARQLAASNVRPAPVTGPPCQVARAACRRFGSCVSQHAAMRQWLNAPEYVIIQTTDIVAEGVSLLVHCPFLYWLVGR